MIRSRTAKILTALSTGAVMFSGGAPAEAHDGCQAPVNYQTAPTGVQATTLAGCTSQHNTMMVSVCMQQYSGGNWACIDGSYKSQTIHNSPGPIQLYSGYYCRSLMRGRVHLQAWNNEGVKSHDILNFGSNKTC